MAAEDVGSLVVRIEADLRDFQSGINQINNRVETFGSRIKKIGGIIAGAFAVKAITNFASESIRVFSEFQQNMANVQAILNATDADMEILTKTAKELGKTTSFSAKQAAEGMQFLGMAGFETNEIIEAMPGLLDLAAASGTELGVTADIVSDALTAFGLEASQTGHFADILAKASSTANTNVEMLGESFKYAAPIAKAFGLSAEETTAALALMANSGIKASQAGTSLRGALIRLAKPPKAAAEALMALNIQTSDAQGNMLDFNIIMGQLRNKFKDLTEEQKLSTSAQIFGTEALSGMMAVLGASTEEFDKYTQTLVESDGAAKKMAETQLDTLAGAFKIFQSAIEGVRVDLVDKFEEPLKRIIQWATAQIPIMSKSISNAFNAISKSILWLKDNADILIPVISGLVVALTTMTIIKTINKAILASRAIYAAWQASTFAQTLAQYGLNAALLANPIGLVVIAIGALVAAGVALYMHWDKVKVMASHLWIYLKVTFENIKKSIFSTWEGIQRKTSEIFTSIETSLNNAWSYIRNITSNMVKSISVIIDSLLKIIQGITDFIIGVFTGDWERAWEGIKNIFTGIFKGLIKESFKIGTNIAKGIINGIDGMLGAVGDKAIELASSIGNAVKDFLGIKSPSKLMAEYGKFIAEGLALGIKENATKAEKAAFKMAQDTVKTFDRLGNTILDALRKRYDKEESYQLSALNKQTEAIRKNVNERIQEYNRELAARLSTIDVQSSEELKAVQDQINNINNLTEQEGKELETQEHAKRVSDLEKQISEAETAKERRKIQKELNNIIKNRERKLLLESRQDKIEALRNEMNDIRNQANEKKKRLQEEFETKKENLRKKEEIIIAGFQREINTTKEHFNILREEENIQAEARRLTAQKNNNELINLLETYNPKWQDAGQSFGESLLFGLNSQKQSIENTINEIFSMIDNARTGTGAKVSSYIVRSGDTLSAIASKFKTTISELVKLNKISDINLIRVGQELKLPAFANGVQNFKGGTALVGERGPELVNLPKGSDVVPNNQIGTNNINFEGMFKGAIFNVRNDTDIKLIAREIYNLQEQRRRGSGVVFG